MVAQTNASVVDAWVRGAATGSEPIHAVLALGAVFPLGHAHCLTHFCFGSPVLIG